MIRWEQQEGGDWQGRSGALLVASVTRAPDGESWLWTITAIKRPKGWRKGSGHRTTWLDAQRAADEYWERWLAEAALRPDLGRLTRESLAAEKRPAARRRKPPS